MDKLLEGMRGGDLEDLMLPLVSIDEFVSKIDDQAVVTAFYVNEHGAAEDLNRFIQRSPIELLDSEISPAPDQHGYYMVFVEMLGNDQFAANLAALLDEVAPLANIGGWKMQLRGADELAPFSEEEVARHLEANQVPNPVNESILDYLSASVLRNAEIFAGQLTLTGCGLRQSYVIESFGPEADFLQTLGESSLALRFADLADVARLQQALGGNWAINKVGDRLAVQRAEGEPVLVLKAVHN